MKRIGRVEKGIKEGWTGEDKREGRGVKRKGRVEKKGRE